MCEAGGREGWLRGNLIQAGGWAGAKVWKTELREVGGQGKGQSHWDLFG